MEVLRRESPAPQIESNDDFLFIKSEYRNRIVFDEEVYIPVSEQYKEKFQEYLGRNFLL
ncbi:MAG: hypothetical protein H6558_17390 [Lewinellaceae bacterium]|nr:hypothetical protein [Lewinellaceae bacterium]MCB9287694.1 hypothetical protein [Lewinellaceae bacterium]